MKPTVKSSCDCGKWKERLTFTMHSAYGGIFFSCNPMIFPYSLKIFTFSSLNNLFDLMANFWKPMSPPSSLNTLSIRNSGKIETQYVIFECWFRETINAPIAPHTDFTVRNDVVEILGDGVNRNRCTLWILSTDTYFQLFQCQHKLIRHCHTNNNSHPRVLWTNCPLLCNTKFSCIQTSKTFGNFNPTKIMSTALSSSASVYTLQLLWNSINVLPLKSAVKKNTGNWQQQQIVARNSFDIWRVWNVWRHPVRIHFKPKVSSYIQFEFCKR